MKTSFLFGLLLVSGFCAHAQPLSLTRKADTGIRLQKTTDQPGALITSVLAGSAAEKSGLRAGDLVISINGVALSDEYTLQKELRKLRGGVSMRLAIRKPGSAIVRTVQFTPPAAPLE
ncbi:MAG: PDZ domain-containing protein [Cyclobacteriaceae bacterium]|jgi:S1-C subfamily serine protease|nr:PDZ domain-containing protein [Cyclobacteriaceae bacterium]